MSKSATVNVMCQVHEKGNWSAHAKKLQACLQSAYATHTRGQDSLRCIWANIPEGQGWLAGHISTASTILLPVPDDITQVERVNMMTQICDDWMEITGCSVDEIIVNAMPKSEAKKYFALAFTRFDPDRGTRFKLRLGLRLLWSKIVKGYFATSTNLP